MKTAMIRIECISDAFMLKAKEYFDKKKFRESAFHILTCITEFDEKNNQIVLINSWLNENEQYFNNTLILIGLIEEIERIETVNCLKKESQKERLNIFKKEIIEYIFKYARNSLNYVPHKELIDLLLQLYRMGHHAKELNDKIKNFIFKEIKIEINGKFIQPKRDKNSITTSIEFPNNVLKIYLFNEEVEWTASEDYFDKESSLVADLKYKPVVKFDVVYAIVTIYTYGNKLQVEIIAKEFLNFNDT